MPSTELIPLPGYQASLTVDIADVDGKACVVGNSVEPTHATWLLEPLPQTTATLWADGQIIYLSKPPGVDPAEWDSSEAIRINAKGDVLCMAYTSGGHVYYVWQKEGVPAINLGTEINALWEAIDLNDNRQLLVVLNSGALLVHDLNGGPPTSPPPFPSVNNILFQYHPRGIDNNGRVVAISCIDGIPESRIAFWTPGTPSWRVFDALIDCYGDFTDSDLYLGTNAKSGQAYYYDLNSAGTPQPTKIPFLQTPPAPAYVSGFHNFYLDANSSGQLVGGEGIFGPFTPTLFDKNTTEVTSLAGYFDALWSWILPIGISDDRRIIGYGQRAGLTRGWILDLASGKSSYKRIQWSPYQAAIDWRSLYFPWKNLPDPPPPIEYLRQLIQHMKPEERSRLLALVQRRAAYYKDLGSVIRKGGRRGKGSKE